MGQKAGSHGLLLTRDGATRRWLVGGRDSVLQKNEHRQAVSEAPHPLFLRLVSQLKTLRPRLFSQNKVQEIIAHIQQCFAIVDVGSLQYLHTTPYRLKIKFP